MGSCVTHRPTPGTWEISQREPGPPFLSNQEITPPTGGPLPCSKAAPRKVQGQGGVPLHPSFPLPPQLSPLSRLECNISFLVVVLETAAKVLLAAGKVERCRGENTANCQGVCEEGPAVDTRT